MLPSKISKRSEKFMSKYFHDLRVGSSLASLPSFEKPKCNSIAQRSITLFSPSPCCHIWKKCFCVAWLCWGAGAFLCANNLPLFPPTLSHTGRWWFLNWWKTRTNSTVESEKGKKNLQSRIYLKLKHNPSTINYVFWGSEREGGGGGWFGNVSREGCLEYKLGWVHLHPNRFRLQLAGWRAWCKCHSPYFIKVVSHFAYVWVCVRFAANISQN